MENNRTFASSAKSIMKALYPQNMTPKGIDVNALLSSDNRWKYAIPYLYALSQYETTDKHEVMRFENIHGQLEDNTDANYLIGYLVANLLGCDNPLVAKAMSEMSALCDGEWDEYIRNGVIVDADEDKYDYDDEYVDEKSTKDKVLDVVNPILLDKLGIEVGWSDVSIVDGIVFIKPFQGAGWSFDCCDAANFWFEGIDSCTYKLVDFAAIEATMREAAEALRKI